MSDLDEFTAQLNAAQQNENVPMPSADAR